MARAGWFGTPLGCASSTVVRVTCLACDTTTRFSIGQSIWARALGPDLRRVSAWARLLLSFTIARFDREARADYRNDKSHMRATLRTGRKTRLPIARWEKPQPGSAASQPNQHHHLIATQPHQTCLTPPVTSQLSLLLKGSRSRQR